MRFFHIHDISPSGWIGFNSKRVKQVRGGSKTTTCTYEYEIESKYIVPLNSKETIVPYKICSFDIEASSSHGDFPIPIKTYKKLATNIVDVCGPVLQKMNADLGTDAESETIRYETIEKLLKRIIYTAFHHEKDPHPDVDRIYTKIKVGESRLATLFGVWITYHIPDIQSSAKLQDLNTIEKMFEKMSQDVNQGDGGDGGDDDGCDGEGDGEGDEGNEYEEVGEVEEVDDLENMEDVEDIENQGGNDEADKLMRAYAGNGNSPAASTKKHSKPKKSKEPKETPKETPVHLLLSTSDKMDRETKINMLNVSLQEIFPPVEGDKVT